MAAAVLMLRNFGIFCAVNIRGVLISTGSDLLEARILCLEPIASKKLTLDLTHSSTIFVSNLSSFVSGDFSIRLVMTFM